MERGWLRLGKIATGCKGKTFRIWQSLHCLRIESCSPSILVLGNNRFTNMNDGKVALFSLKKEGKQSLVLLTVKLLVERIRS